MARIILYGVLIPAVIIFPNFRGIFTESSDAVKALEKQGWSNVRITNHNVFLVGFRGCDAADAAKFTAIAKNTAGKEVEVFVCMGWPFKGSTIRTD